MDKYYENAVGAIYEVYNDKSCSASETINNLESLKDEIEFLIDALKLEEK